MARRLDSLSLIHAQTRLSRRLDRALPRCTAAPRAIALACWVGFGLLPACGRGEKESPPETQRDAGAASSSADLLRVAVPAAPIITDPLAPERQFHLSLVPYLCPALLMTTFDPTGTARVHGDLATRWTWYEVDRRLVVDLDPARAWSNGKAIDDGDVIDSFRSHLSQERSGGRSSGGTGAHGLVDVSSPSPGQVELLFSESTPEWRALQVASLPIVPLEAREASSPRTGRGESIPTGGLYRVAERDGGRVVMIPSEQFGARMRLSGVALEVVTSADTRLLRVSAGLNDVALDIPVQKIRELGMSDDVVLHDAGPGSVEMLCWNLERQELTLALREAVSLAINRSRMAEIFCDEDTCFGGPASGLLDPEAEPILPDRARAERLLAPDSLRTIRMLYDRSNETRERIAIYLEEDLAHVGIQLRAVPLDGPEVLRRFQAGEFEAALLGFVPSGASDCGDLWSSAGSWNGMRFRDARVDSLCGETRRAQSADQARELILEIEDLVRRRMPVTFLVHRRRIDAVSRQVSGFAGTTWQPLGPLENVTRLRAPAGEVRMTAATPREETR